MKHAALALASLALGAARASDLIDVSPLSDRIVLLHFKDGHVVHHKLGQRRSEETVAQAPLDVAAASKAGSYRIVSRDDPAFGVGRAPVDVGRKSKGTDFSWHVDRWVDGRPVNDAPDHTKEHWVSLVLPRPLSEGRTYTLATGDLAANGRFWNLAFGARKVRAESVHANVVGYAPAAPAKFAYVYAWMGDRGGLDVRPLVGRRFWLVDQGTGKDAFEGRVAFRRDAKSPETQQANDTPNANFQAADVAECDFSAFHAPGRYAVAVEGVGLSFPFRIDADVYRAPFDLVAKGLYYQRSGIALAKPYAVYARPAPGRPGVTPGFRLVYSSLSSLDYGSESGAKAQIDPTIKGPLDAWGWYQDAGDWDSYETHLRVAQELMLAYEMNPRAFADGELNIPESGNGVPDILDEAAWLPRFGFRLRHELLAKRYGTGGIGLRIAGDAYGGDERADGTTKGSWQDTDRLYVASGEDAQSTFRYAGAAAQLAHCLSVAKAKDPQGVAWAEEARETYAWAAAHTRAKDEEAVRPQRLYAAAALFRLTGDRSYEARIAADAVGAPGMDEGLYGPAIYALSGKGDPALVARVRRSILDEAEAFHQSARKRALRWGGDWGFPMLVGQQSTPLVLPLMVGWKLTGSQEYLADLYTTADYFLGTNALNMAWATGLGPRHPERVFHMDSWYLGDGSPYPGLVPYGPWRKERDRGQGPWDHDWPNASVYPAIDLWPGAERWFDDRAAPLSSEFTIHQDAAPAAALYGLLCGVRPR